MRTVIRNCRLLSPGFNLVPGAILIENENIAAVFRQGDELPATEEAEIDANGLIAVPGFVDVHCHGRSDIDFCDGSVEGVNRIAREKLQEGVTTLLPTTLTLPEEQLTAGLRAIAQYDGKGCRIPGVHLEGPYINARCAGAQNPAFARLPDIEEVKRLKRIFPVLKVSFAPELEGAARFTSQLIELGITPSVVHSAANYREFEACYDAGLRNLSHFCNQMSPLHHRDIGLVGAGLLKDDVYLELICDKLHLCPEMIELVFKIKKPGHIMLVTDTTRPAGMPDGDYDLGGIPIFLKNGEIRLKEGGNIAGSSLMLNTGFRNITEITGLEPEELVRSTSLTAAESLNLSGIGKLEPGYLADIVLLNPDFKIRKTIVGGEVRYES